MAIEIYYLIWRVKNIINYRGIRNDLINELKTFIIGPRKDDEILGKQIRQMQVNLSGELVSFGATSDAVNERENAIGTHAEISEEQVYEQLKINKICKYLSMCFSFKQKELVPIEMAVYEDGINSEKFIKK